MVRARVLVVVGALTLAACASSVDGAGPVTTTGATTTSAMTTGATTTASTTAAVTTTATTATTLVEAGPALFSFATADGVDGWRTQNDPVMGGVSTGELAWADGTLVFEGQLSLANGGGFASLVSPPFDASPWASSDGVRLDVVGDGRTYVLQLRGEDARGGWTQPFATPADVAVTVRLAWDGFEPVDRFLRPTTATTALDPAAVRSLAVYLLDAREGPFRLAVRTIR
jgi:NADH dehydrogenase [ubiquinone] 1 alpha subcomplex assembly factor 1